MGVLSLKLLASIEVAIRLWTVERYKYDTNTYQGVKLAVHKLIPQRNLLHSLGLLEVIDRVGYQSGVEDLRRYPSCASLIKQFPRLFRCYTRRKRVSPHRTEITCLKSEDQRWGWKWSFGRIVGIQINESSILTEVENVTQLFKLACCFCDEPMVLHLLPLLIFKHGDVFKYLVKHPLACYWLVYGYMMPLQILKKRIEGGIWLHYEVSKTDSLYEALWKVSVDNNYSCAAEYFQRKALAEDPASFIEKKNQFLNREYSTAYLMEECLRFDAKDSSLESLMSHFEEGYLSFHSWQSGYPYFTASRTLHLQGLDLVISNATTDLKLKILFSPDAYILCSQASHKTLLKFFTQTVVDCLRTWTFEERLELLTCYTMSKTRLEYLAEIADISKSVAIGCNAEGFGTVKRKLSESTIEQE